MGYGDDFDEFDKIEGVPMRAQELYTEARLEKYTQEARAEQAQRERDEAREGRENWKAIAETRGAVSDGMKARVAELNERIAELEAALALYADEDNWEICDRALEIYGGFLAGSPPWKPARDAAPKEKADG